MERARLLLEEKRREGEVLKIIKKKFPKKEVAELIEELEGLRARWEERNGVHNKVE